MKKVLLKIIMMTIITAILLPTACTNRGNKKTTKLTEKDSIISLDNGIASISFSKETGIVSQMANKTEGTDFLLESGSVPFRINIDEETIDTYSEFNYSKNESMADGKGFELKWKINDNVNLIANVSIKDNSDEIVFTSKVENNSKDKIYFTEYPVIGGIDTLGETSEIAHSYATGFVVKNPHKNFEGDESGFRYMPYPEAFSGATMQFFTYYSKPSGGMYVATHDGENHQKWLNFYKKNDNLEMSHIYGYEDISEGNSPEANYPMIIKMITGERGWYEAADIYKEWAKDQYWCNKGFAADRDETKKAKWLLEDVGMTTFGIAASKDRTEWLKQYSKDVDTKMFHILGPDWTKVTQNFKDGTPGGLEDWEPTRFDKNNLKVIKEQGDYFAPFEFDYLFDINHGSDAENAIPNLQTFPEDAMSTDGYRYTMLCPTTEYAQKLHVQRDLNVLKDIPIDAMYYDISANNNIKIDMNENHNHKAGGSTAITKGYQDIYRSTQEALTAEAKKYMPIGTEMINEVFLSELDYYQARAWGQPASALEGWPLRELLKSGEAYIAPMFTYVYNEYGIVRMDGWGKFVREVGSLYYNTVAKTYAWGGLFEINHEYASMESISGTVPPSTEHYANYDDLYFDYSPEKATYVKQFAALRTGAGNKYLAYGEMQHPLDLKEQKHKAIWYLYTEPATENERGTIEIDTIVQAVWKSKDGNDDLGIILANTYNENLTLNTTIDLEYYNIDTGKKAYLLSDFDGEIYKEQELEISNGTIDLNTELEAFKVYMVEVR